MKEYIERERVIGIAHGYCHTPDGRCCGPDDVVELYEELKAIPAADVVEVVKGEWFVLDGCSNKGIYCSKCHTKIFDFTHKPKKKLSNYCPKCGAKMDGGDHDARLR